MGYKADMSGVKSKIDAICTNSRVGRFAASEVMRKAERYVPYRDGNLRASAIVEPFRITYIAPYAHRQWLGVINGTRISNYTTPGTYPRWTDYVNRTEISQEVTNYIRSL